jgi:multiple sugar transport system substrate-binding protein
MKTKFYLISVIVMLILGACTPLAPTPVPEVKTEAVVPESPTVEVQPEPTLEPVTLQVWVYDSFAKDMEAPIYNAVEKFEQENPGIKIEIIPTQYGSSPYRDKFITAAQAGSGPDALMADIIWTPQFAAAGLILPIDEFAGDEINNFYPGPVATNQYQGKLYGLPFYTNAVAMFYNKTAFIDAGLPLPEAGWTWDDFRQSAITLTKDNQYGFGFMAGYGGTFEWFPWIWQNGGEILNEENTQAAFTNPEGLESAKVFLELMTKDGVVPEAAKSWKSWDELAAAFSNRVIAMYEVGDWGLAAVDGMQPNFEWGVVELPMQASKASVVGGANWVISKNTKNPEAAYKWLSFINGPDVFELMDGYNRLAARSGGQQAIVTADPRMQVFVDSLEYARARPSIPNWTTIDYDCLQPAFLKVILEGADIEASLQEAGTCANNALQAQ